ncbi:MAG: hypothetical protein K8W52_47550 [Deltaproteobacteria bacterium]|nr:hypothetical protein [Deltaproteobacteria bacterium]
MAYLGAGLLLLGFAGCASIIFFPLAIVSFIGAAVFGILAIRWGGRAQAGGFETQAPAVGGLLLTGAVVGVGVMVALLDDALRGAFDLKLGRPLRIGRRQVVANARRGEDWCVGPRPAADGLDAATRETLAALWLHDAQMEHASVPAFARISWMLAAVGAPPALHRAAQQAALDEIDHAERCFAIAAGYGGQPSTVAAMPELAGALASGDDAIDTLVYESVVDGCQHEGFNADVAAAAADACDEPVVRATLQQVAIDEHAHAELAWRLIEWALAREDDRARQAVDRGLRELDRRAIRPPLVGVPAALGARADREALRKHGRLDQDACVALWGRRLDATRQRLSALVAARAAA